MKLSLTNVGKAKSVLLAAGFKNIGKDNPDKFIFYDPDIRELASTGKSNRLNAMDKAGRYLKEALLTRNTAHKKYDFSSIQATSSLNLQQFYSKVGTILDTYDDYDDDQTDIINPTIQPQLDVLSKKIENELTKIQKLAKKDPALQTHLTDTLKSKDIKTCKQAIADDTNFSTIDNNVYHIEQSGAKYKKPMRLRDCAKVPAITIATMTAAGATLGIAAITPLRAFGIIGKGVFGLLFPVTAAAGAIIGLGVSSVVGGGLLIASLSKRFYSKLKGKSATKKAKSIINEMQDHQRKIIKYVNQSAAILRQRQGMTATNETVQECRTALDEFLKKQNNLWGHYATANDREYDDQSGEGTTKNKHKKISSLGKTKEWIANTWKSATIFSFSAK